MPPRLLADITILPANRFLHERHGVVYRDYAAGERPAEHEPPHARRIGRRVDHRHDAAGGVPEQVDRIEPEVGAELLEVGGVILEAVRLRRIGAVDSAGVEQDQPELLVEAREIVEDLDRDPGAARMTNEGRAVAELQVGERATVRRGERGHHNGV